ncbi:MAG: SRPBCC family protein [Actinomycetota bacterium]|nr:SRPBCC family protein [Actinomycetota bacterium]
MAEETTEQMVVAAPPERCYDVVADFPAYPSWASDIKEVTVEERDDEGRPTEVTFRAAAFGRSTSYTLAYDYSNAPTELAWVLTRGDLTTHLDGSYRFAPTGGGTMVTYRLVVELKVPIPGFVKRRAQNRIMTTALRNLQARVESGD